MQRRLQFTAEEAKFAGYITGTKGISGYLFKVKAISRFLKSTNITEMQSFFGLVNQLADFCPLRASTVCFDPVNCSHGTQTMWPQAIRLLSSSILMELLPKHFGPSNRTQPSVQDISSDRKEWADQSERSNPNNNSDLQDHGHVH